MGYDGPTYPLIILRKTLNKLQCITGNTALCESLYQDGRASIVRPGANDFAIIVLCVDWKGAVLQHLSEDLRIHFIAAPKPFSRMALTTKEENNFVAEGTLQDHQRVLIDS